MAREGYGRGPWFRAAVEISLALTIVLLSGVYLVRWKTGVAHLQSPADQPWSIGYWTQWGSPPIPMAAIDWTGLTHVVHSAALVNPDGSLDLSSNAVDANAADLITAAHAAGVKVLLSVCQPYAQGTNGFFQQAAVMSRAALVDSIATAVKDYQYDGVDIDWEPFDARVNGATMRAFVLDLRAAMPEKMMTAAAPAPSWQFWGSVQTQFDRINIMTYDLSGTWDPYSWHNSALFDPDGKVWSVHLAVTRFLSTGVPASKLGIGIPFFGWRWSGGQMRDLPSRGITGPRQNWVASAPPTRAQVYYQHIAPTITPGNYRWDSLALSPYLSVEDSATGSYAFVTYDDARSITEKVNYVYDNHLGGWIIWDLGGDYFPQAAIKQPLMDAIKGAMKSASGQAASQ